MIKAKFFIISILVRNAACKSQYLNEFRFLYEMSLNCQYCGSSIRLNNSETTNKKTNEEVISDNNTSSSSSGWLCFGGWCDNSTSKKIVKKEIVAHNYELPNNGLYQRRRTIQFDLESNGNGVNKSSKMQSSSILKMKVFLYEEFLLF